VNQLLSQLGPADEASADHCLLIDWEFTVGEKRDWSRDSFGRKSYRTGLAWYPPPEGEAFWQKAKLKLYLHGKDFHLSRLDGEGKEVEWWHKEGRYLFSSRMQDFFQFNLRWPAVEAFESGFLAYGEGLGLILWAFVPEDYLKRAENLEFAEDQEIDGKTYRVLRATPSWIKDPPTLPNRRYHPNNQAKLMSWAIHWPVVTYFVDEAEGRICGATFEYFDVTRSHPGKWNVGWAPRDEVLEAWVREWGTTGDGVVFPTKIEGQYVLKGKVVRRLVLRISEVTAPGEEIEFPPLEIDRNRRPYEEWPPYRSSVYRERIAEEGKDYANWVGLINALAFEGDFKEVISELKALLSAFEKDQELVPESLWGIDWHLGYALYEILQHHEEPQFEALWRDFPPEEPYKGILARAVDFFGRWHLSEDNDLAAELFQRFQNQFGQKARVMYLRDRSLIEVIETPGTKARDLEAIYPELRSDDVRLLALTGIIEFYLADGEFYEARDFLSYAASTFETDSGRAQFQELAKGWEKRISEAIKKLKLRALSGEIEATQAMIQALQNRLERLPGQGGEGTEKARIQKILAREQAILAELEVKLAQVEEEE